MTGAQAALEQAAEYIAELVASVALLDTLTDAVRAAHAVLPIVVDAETAAVDGDPA
jgi:hypothetical protein